MTAHIKTNYQTGCIERFSEKTQRCRCIIATAKMEPFGTLVNL